MKLEDSTTIQERESERKSEGIFQSERGKKREEKKEDWPSSSSSSSSRVTAAEAAAPAGLDALLMVFLRRNLRQKDQSKKEKYM